MILMDSALETITYLLELHYSIITCTYSFITQVFNTFYELIHGVWTVALSMGNDLTHMFEITGLLVKLVSKLIYKSGCGILYMLENAVNIVSIQINLIMYAQITVPYAVLFH